MPTTIALAMIFTTVPVLEQQLPDQDVVGADPTLLQQEAESETEDDALHDDARLRRLGGCRMFAGLNGLGHGVRS
jgi:hypothetical protein